MLEHARRVVAAAEAEAPKWFATVPDVACTVAAVPEAEEAGHGGAYYMPGAIDGSRPGTYYLNTSQPEERHRYGAEDIAFHEAVPGHHFQLTIAMESKDLVPARQVLYDTACAEGWGLYAERLADEMGLYSDDLARMGLFAADAWRASRLVVDTGLHALGWSRQQAIDWMAAHAPLPRAGGRQPRSTATSRFPARPWPTWWAGARSCGCAPRRPSAWARDSTSGSSTTWCCRSGSSPCPR